MTFNVLGMYCRKEPNQVPLLIPPLPHQWPFFSISIGGEQNETLSGKDLGAFYEESSYSLVSFPNQLGGMVDDFVVDLLHVW
jgi:hypothetical protein